MTWVPVEEGSGFGLENLPLGVFTPPGEDDRPRVGTRIGDFVLDVAALWAGLPLGADLAHGSLNRFLRRGPGEWAYLRRELVRVLSTDERRAHAERNLYPVDRVRMLLPIEVADFADFYACREHAENAGRILRPGEPPLLPNWRRMPVAYHGRAGTVVVSGTEVRRPRGQLGPGVVGPTERLDFEAEVGFVVGAPSRPGVPVGTGAFAEHVFGVVLLNDWSARDIQAWEYRPLGPFLGKSFATSISPWVVPMAALEEARVAGPRQEPEPVDYLKEEQPAGLDVELEVRLNGELLSRPRYGGMYWSAAQMLAHLTVGGAAVRTGDLFGSGTVSGEGPERQGCLLEMTRNGEVPVRTGAGRERWGYLADGDVITLGGSARGPGGARLSLGEVSGRVRAAEG
ncbi:fumarylacetoacetate hydrolase family protein [Phaeacidiphilus oryzae]|uniref:fumarylacetoacetate hydrolase family protein n=1 Tax=Phaeacidiphilus oryzae TaxID=348818 RepID=UPI00056D7D3D|nr:fumarylacetoacetate hydrolase family protein [Phaeacidiphilus oryzae]